MFDTSQNLFLVARSVTLAGLSVFALASANMAPAHAQCRDQQAQLAATRTDPRYPALQQALDTYVADRRKTEGFTGASLLVSLVTPPASRSSIDSTACASGHPSNSHVWTVLVGGSTSR